MGVSIGWAALQRQFVQSSRPLASAPAGLLFQVKWNKAKKEKKKREELMKAEKKRTWRTRGAPGNRTRWKETDAPARKGRFRFPSTSRVWTFPLVDECEHITDRAKKEETDCLLMLPDGKRWIIYPQKDNDAGCCVSLSLSRFSLQRSTFGWRGRKEAIVRDIGSNSNIQNNAQGKRKRERERVGRRRSKTSGPI